jgi:1-acyl-sn-glycerol-3-phosphate acyltransferase
MSLTCADRASPQSFTVSTATAVFRLARVLLHLAGGLATCAFIFPFIGAAARASHVRRWSGELLSVCGVQVRVIRRDGGEAGWNGLTVANHVSWLDVFVINTVQPCRFVAKSEIRGWPLMGWLAHKTGTIFIARGRVRDVRRIFEGLVSSLTAGESVAFFPEGTTAPQGAMLAFHPNLFEAAIDAHVPIQPCAVRYVDAEGNWHRAADFVGETTFAQSLMRIVKARSVVAELVVLPAISSEGAHRRELAEATQNVIAIGLGKHQA